MSYTTVDLVSAELKGLDISSTTTPDTSTVTQWIADADAEIDARTGKTWSSTAFTSTYLDYEGDGYVRFPYSPLISISSFQYETNGLGNDSSNWESLTEGRNNDYIIYVNDAEIMFTGKTLPSKGYQKLCLSGIYGYATTPAKIQLLATKLVAKRVMDATINAQAQEGGSVTVSNISIDDPTSFGANQSKNLKIDIDDLFKDLVGDSRRVYRPKRTYELRY